jgi:hypothetical protein
MPSCSDPVTSSRFQAHIPAGEHALAFRVAFKTDGEAARFLGVSRMQVWRWRHSRANLPAGVAKTLAEIVQDKLGDAVAAQQQLRLFLERPPAPRRPLSGCCERYERPGNA